MQIRSSKIRGPVCSILENPSSHQLLLNIFFTESSRWVPLLETDIDSRLCEKVNNQIRVTGRFRNLILNI